jgi:mannose-6-phosphate isomerase
MLRVRSAARQIYVFADAPTRGFGTASHLSIAEAAFERLHRAAWIDGAEPGYARVINRIDDTAIDTTRDLYDNACVLLALGALYRATRRPVYRQRAALLLEAIDGTLASELGGWREDNLAVLPRRQNPHMHLFEACLFLAEATGEPAYFARLDTILELLERRFMRDGLLHEFFGPGWELARDFTSHRLDPGHMCEWVWLLSGYSRLTGHDMTAIAESLLEAARRLGPAGGAFMVDEVDATGRPLRNCRRLWLQCEWMKAFHVSGQILGPAAALANADALAERILAVYLADTPFGTWRDNFDLAGRFIAKSIPASSLYHLWTAIAEIARNSPSPKTAMG